MYRLVWGHLKLPEKMFENLSACWLGSYFVWLVLYATSLISIILRPRSGQMLRSLEVVSDHLWPISNFCSLRIVEGDHWRLSFFWGSKLPQHQNIFMKTVVSKEPSTEIKQKISSLFTSSCSDDFRRQERWQSKAVQYWGINLELQIIFIFVPFWNPFSRSWCINTLFKLNQKSSWQKIQLPH